MKRLKLNFAVNVTCPHDNGLIGWWNAGKRFLAAGVEIAAATCTLGISNASRREPICNYVELTRTRTKSLIISAFAFDVSSDETTRASPYSSRYSVRIFAIRFDVEGSCNRPRS